MPYIKDEFRKELLDRDPKDVGELNYTITKLCKEYIKVAGENYYNYNKLLGAIEVAKTKFEAAVYQDLRLESAAKISNDIYNIVYKFYNRVEPDIEDMLGVFKGVDHEFYRRMVASYEDVKIIQNGDV